MQAAPSNITEQLSNIIQHIAARNVDVVDNKSPFFSHHPPAIGLDQYIQRMSDYMYCSKEAYVLASVLITRLEEASKQSLILPGSMHRLVLTATVIAAKTNDDVFLDNKHYSEVGGITLQEMNSLELYMLEQLEYRVFVHPDQYATCLDSMQSLNALITNTASPAAMEDAQRLRRSSSVVDMVVEDVMRFTPPGRRTSCAEYTRDQVPMRRSSVVGAQ